jgi:hypothetical protein
MTVTNESGRSVFGSRPYNPLLVSSAKRKVFVSYHHGDELEARKFVSDFAGPSGVFTHRALGLSFTDDLIDSTNPEYVMRRIREDYLGDSTVTIVLIGTCTHSRRFVDWEIKASLQQGTALPNGLIGILLPSATPGLLRARYPELPPRFNDNLAQHGLPGYAQFQNYPTNTQQVREWIEVAFDSRSRQAQYISNGREMMRYNSRCANCGVTH